MKNAELINKMTLWEKALFMSGRDIWSTWNFDHLGIKSIYLSDGPHGIRKQMGESDHLGLNESMKSTCFPTSATVANSWDIKLAEEIGQCLGDEAVQLGVNVVLGPGLNVKKSPLCGRNFEYFSEDPYHTGKLASAYVKGIQSRDVSACPKHFAVNSQELRRMHNDSVLDERTLREIYLRGFEIIVDEANPKFIMTSYNKVNGAYANENSHLLQDILVDEWKFEGAVVSDWGGSFSHVDGVKAGSHLEMPGTRVMGAKELIDAIKSGELSEDVLNKRVDELLTIVLKLSENKNIVGKNLEQDMIDKHHNIAKRAARESVVLLENKDNILPLKSGVKLSVVGEFAKNPRYQGAGSSVVNTTKLDSIMSVIGDYGFSNVVFSEGYERNDNPNEELVKAAVANSKDADYVVVFAGLTEVFESEGVDRKHMNLPENQNHLIKTLCKEFNNVIVVLAGGSPVELPWVKDVNALVHGYLGGQAGASAVLDVITGKHNPSGKLNESYALKYSDVPNAKYYPGNEKTSEYRESIFIGYRYYESAKVDVLYPFGYGLSYTTFEYSNFIFNKDNNTASLSIKNTGSVDGYEIAQIYSSLENSNIFRASKELVGFTKVFVKASETVDVTIELNKRIFEYFNINTNKWETEKGSYKLLAGKSVKDIVCEVVVDVEGTTSENPYNKDVLSSYYSAKITNVADSEFKVLLGREIPDSKWDTTQLLGYGDTISQLYYAKNPIARLVHKILTNMIAKNEKIGKPDLNVLFIYNQTFTAIYKMTNGMLNKKMTTHLLDIVNGHFFRGISKLIPAYFENNKLSKTVLEDLKKSKN
ncbi:MAG: beta-glucosidase [Lachnospirales bacterium]